jgi:hypothetical protein
MTDLLGLDSPRKGHVLEGTLRKLTTCPSTIGLVPEPVVEVNSRAR